MSKKSLTVGDVARAANVTVRTLHHYDEIGLVVPARTPAGYRVYGPEHIDRLQEVLFFRELGFGLDEVTRIVADPTYVRESALRRQRSLLEGKARRLKSMLKALDEAIESEITGVAMNHEEKLAVFGDFDPSKYVEEARERWGNSNAYRQSARRTSRYTKDDWARIQADAADIYAAFVTLMKAGVEPDSAEAGRVVERHRVHIETFYYDCSAEVHRGLGQMYVSDDRFRKNIDQHGEGLAAYMAAAIDASD